MREILEAHQVRKEYLLGRTVVPALNHVDLKVRAGEMVCIMGPSGSGKSTLLNLLGLLDKPTSGQIFLKNHSTSSLSLSDSAKMRSSFLGFIFQSFNLLPVLSAFENVEFPLYYHALSGKERHRKVSRALEDVGLSEVAHHRPDELSGGQRQRVAVARALVTDPLLILADEPTANLDSESAQSIMTLMQNLNRNHQTTFIFSTHDPRVVHHATRIVKISDGVVHENSPLLSEVSRNAI